MAIINVRRGPRGPLANYVQAVRKGMSGRGMGQDDSGFDDTSVPTNIMQLTPGADLSSIGSTFFGDLSGGISSFDSSITGGSTPATGSPATASNASGSVSSFLTGLTADAASAAKIFNSLQTPALIPGTNAIYNAATGQYYNPTTGQVVNPNGSGTLGLPTDLSSALPQILLFGGLALGAMVLLGALGKH